MNMNRTARVEMVTREIEHAMRTSKAFVLVDRDLRETLVIVTADMSHGQSVVDGAKKGQRLRATTFWKDGPVGHVSHANVAMIASDIAEDYQPNSSRRITRDQADAWMGTDEFAKGCERVTAVQRENEARR